MTIKKAHQVKILCLTFSWILLITFPFCPKAKAIDEHASLHDQYQNLLQTIKGQSTKVDQESLSPYSLILVPGIWTENYPRYFDTFRSIGLPVPEGKLKAFADQLSWLSNLGIDMQLATITSQNCDENASFLHKMILKSRKKVILITHSKGGLDVLHLLVNYPKIRGKIAGWLSLQTPYLGTPLIEFVQSTSFKGRSIRWILEMSLGGIDSLTCILPDFRQLYLKENEDSIAEIYQKIPVINFSSWKKPSTITAGLSFFEPFIRWFYKQDQEQYNDGLVSTKSSCLANTDCLILENLDHAAPVMDIKPFPSYGTENRILFTRTLLSLLLNRMPISSIVE